MTAVTGTVDAGVDLLLKDATTALTFYLDLGLALLWLVEEVYSCLGEGVHWLN